MSIDFGHTVLLVAIIIFEIQKVLILLAVKTGVQKEF
jgi:hypothetical protein